ncbi:MAG: hypothetical protein ACPGYM_03830 [Flavobacteriales bacterium]
MKKLFTLLLAAACFTGSAQLFYEDFESYSDGDGISTSAGQPWALWTAGATDQEAYISNEVAMSGNNSLKLESASLTGGPQDIMLIAGLVSGSYEVTFSMFVPEGHSGYYNVQENQIQGTAWAFEAVLNGDGSIAYEVNGDVLMTGSYQVNSWLTITHFIDTESDLMNVLLNGAFLGQVPYDGLEVGGVNFYAAGDQVNLPLYYVDDVFVDNAVPVEPYADNAGCTDSIACNFDSDAIYDDGSCNYETCAGCTDSAACNYLAAAEQDDGSCHYLCNYCLEGTVWNEAEGGCVLDPSSCGWQPDSNDDQLIGVDDLLMFLSVFGDTDYDQDGVFDSADLCMDEEACNYLANPTEPCAFLDAAGICGGTCETDIEGDGVCDDPCPEGYTGVVCSEQITPSSMEITAIHVLDFPAYTSNGFAWDTNGTAPDIYVSLWDSGNNYELYSAEWIPNTLPPDEGYHWPFNNLNWDVDPNETYRFKLYDDDTLDFDDYMGQFHAIIYASDNGFPSQSTFTNDDVSFRVYFDYDW